MNYKRSCFVTKGALKGMIISCNGQQLL